MMPDPVEGHSTPGMHLWGWMSPVELEWLASEAAKMRSVVEIGCLHGRSSFALATACPGTVYCVDPWSDDGWASWSRSMAGFDNVVAIRDYSPAAGVGVPDPVDMVFIDGAHDAVSVRADIDYWRTRATVLLCGHDYIPYSSLDDGDNPGFPDVATVVDEIFGDAVTVAPDTAIWVVRPKAR